MNPVTVHSLTYSCFNKIYILVGVFFPKSYMKFHNNSSVETSLSYINDQINVFTDTEGAVIDEEGFTTLTHAYFCRITSLIIL